MLRRNRKFQYNEQPHIGKVMDFSVIKNFIDYGMNKSLLNLKLRRMVDIQTREKLSKMKPETDWMKVLITILIVVIVGVIAFSIISQYFDYQDVARQNANLLMENGVLRGQIAQLKMQLGNITANASNILHG